MPKFDLKLSMWDSKAFDKICNYETIIHEIEIHTNNN
jgi:hypothetical protein